MTKDTAEPTTAEGVAGRPDVLSMERAAKAFEDLGNSISLHQADMVNDLRKGWSLSTLANYHGSRAITNETWSDLWRIVVTGDATDKAWGKALTTAMEWATRDERTTGIEEGTRHERQRAATRWIRNNRRSFAALPQEVLAWAPFEF
jgi:hypothetical protein